MGVVNQHRVYASGNPSVIRLPANAVADVARLLVLGLGCVGKMVRIAVRFSRCEDIEKGAKGPFVLSREGRPQPPLNGFR